jgi:glycosyltransferase involved in cell wall biosynthesis
MKVLLLARSTLYTVYGGDTVQIISTAKYLRKIGVEADIKLCNENINYSEYDLLHVFNAIRPADALYHIKKSKLLYVLSTIFVDFSEYHKANDKGIKRLINRILSPDQFEYVKAIGRWIVNGEKIQSKAYLLLGHYRSVKKLAKGAKLLLPNSHNEYTRFAKAYHLQMPYEVIYNGIDLDIFKDEDSSLPIKRDDKNVICVARIEGKKNQLNLIKALNNTEFALTLIGKPAPNHIKYFEECKSIAAANIKFIDFLPQEKLSAFYKQAKVHVLPSWNETCGLSSLESAYNGCNLVITDKGDTEEYFGNNALYCNPANTKSIYEAIKKASEIPTNDALKRKILETYNWENAAKDTKSAYMQVLKNASNAY